MQLCCTKKLLDEIGIVPGNELEAKDLFCWSAHLIMVNRKKTIVVVNDSNRFGFILYGLKAKDFKSLNEIILQGIRCCLSDEKIKEEIIEQYLQTAGTLVFTKTRGAKYVARLNKACEVVNIINDTMDSDVIFQIMAGRHMNNDYIKIEKSSDYEHPHVLLRKDFEQFAGGQIFRCEAADLLIKLNLGSHTAWRRIVTPADATFRQLHEILQVAFDWKGYHSYEFIVFDQIGAPVLNVISESEEVYEPRQGCKTMLDMEVRLSDYAHKDGKILYCYDFGDNWEHEIVVHSIINDYDKNYPVCLKGEKNAPPEDVGGVSGYEEFLEIMKNPKHIEYENTRQWAESQWYKDFNIDSVNRRLKNILR